MILTSFDISYISDRSTAPIDRSRSTVRRVHRARIILIPHHRIRLELLRMDSLIAPSLVID